MSDQKSPFSADFLAKQRTRLEALRTSLLGGEENTIASERADQTLRGSEAQEFEDDAQSMAQKEVNQNLRNTNDLRISEIERALQKLAEGTYGYSDESGDVIPIGRLEAVPEAILTVAEQEKRDAAGQ
jgi:DnaK suppressor protein